MSGDDGEKVLGVVVAVERAAGRNVNEVEMTGEAGDDIEGSVDTEVDAGGDGGGDGGGHLVGEFLEREVAFMTRLKMGKATRYLRLKFSTIAAWASSSEMRPGELELREGESASQVDAGEDDSENSGVLEGVTIEEAFSSWSDELWVKACVERVWKRSWRR